MPTGYTAALYEGEQTFEEYALGVARAFGALITMRDDPADAEIPEKFAPSEHAVSRVEEAEEDLAGWTSMDDAEMAKRMAGEMHESKQYRDRYVRDRAALRARYEAMLVKARAFVPPTPEHVEYARMLVEQLESSIKFDCGSYEPSVKSWSTVDEYRDSKMEAARSELRRAHEGLRDEERRARDRTAWVGALRGAIASAARPADEAQQEGPAS